MAKRPWNVPCLCSVRKSPKDSRKMLIETIKGMYMIGAPKAWIKIEGREGRGM
jgi:hypothetical protein